MLRGQAEHLAARLRREALRTQEVGIKIRYASWETHTRQLRLPASTDDPAVLAAAAATLMRRHWERGRAVRLIGLRVARFATAATYQQLPLFDPYLFAGEPRR